MSVNVDGDNKRSTQHSRCSLSYPLPHGFPHANVHYKSLATCQCSAALPLSCPRVSNPRILRSRGADSFGEEAGQAEPRVCRVPLLPEQDQRGEFLLEVSLL